MIRQHPDYEKCLFLQDAPPDAPARARAGIFIAAAVWPDQIKGDPQILRRDPFQCLAHWQLLPGFPDMARHTIWHYYDTPYAPDGAEAERLKNTPRALSGAQPHASHHQGTKADVPPTSASNPVYLLPWLEHITGDVHQPLHCVSRFLKSMPKGDAGGNNVYITGTYKNLHSLWDGAAGRDDTEAYAVKYIAEARQPPNPPTRRIREEKPRAVDSRRIRSRHLPGLHVRPRDGHP